MAQILPEHRTNISIHHSSAEPVELFNLWQDFMREGEILVREFGANQRGNTLFVAGIEVGEQQTDGQGLHPFPLQRRERLRHRRLVERGRDVAIPAYALWHAQAQVARHEWLYWGHAQVVTVLFH